MEPMPACGPTASRGRGERGGVDLTCLMHVPSRLILASPMGVRSSLDTSWREQHGGLCVPVAQEAG